MPPSAGKDALWILHSDSNYYASYSLDGHLNELRIRRWIVQIQYVLRDGNKLADALTKSAKCDNVELVYFSTPPDPVISFLHEDMSGN
ncbi:hypothetical protein V6N13_088827 [Hibiscus sabdariffa]